MILNDFFQQKYRDVVAVYPQENIAYMACLRVDQRNGVSLMWVDSVAGETAELRQRLTARLVIHGSGGSEVVFCIGDQLLETVAREMSGLTPKEAEQAIKLEMEYSGESCRWTYKYQDDWLTVKKLSAEDYGNFIDDYRGDVSIAGVVALEPREVSDELWEVMEDFSWGNISPDNLCDDERELICTAFNYIRELGYSFEGVPAIFYRWNWLKIGALFLAINVLISVFICLGFFLKNQELAEESHGYKQQLALLENANDIKKEARELAVTSKTKAGILASLQDRGLGMSGYAVMVHLSHVPATGITLDEVRAENNKELILKGKAENVGLLVKYISTLGREISIEKTQQGEQGNVEFICKGQL